jgi:hypothetical protein
VPRRSSHQQRLTVLEHQTKTPRHTSVHERGTASTTPSTRPSRRAAALAQKLQGRLRRAVVRETERVHSTGWQSLVL